MIKKIAYLGLFLVFSSNAQIFKNFEQEGFNHQTITPMNSYGMAVPVVTGLKSAIPSGWQVFIHEKAELPKTVYWNLGDPWLKVFSNLADKENLSVLVDWDKKSIFIRPLEVALAEKEIKDKLTLAASTPLPKSEHSKPTVYSINTKDKSPLNPNSSVDFKAQVNDVKVELKISAANSGDPLTQTVIPSLTMNPSEEQIKSKLDRNFEVKPEYKSSALFELKGPTAFNRASVKSVSQLVANKYNVPLRWTSSDQNFVGPVTILGRSLEEDILLINKALGVHNSLKVVYKEGAIWSSVNGVTKGVICCSVNVSLNKNASFKVSKGQDLKAALDTYLASIGYSLDWKADARFESQQDVVLNKPSLSQLLAEILPSLGLSAMIDSKQKVVFVTAHS